MGLTLRRWRADADVTVTCGYPYTNWVLRSPVPGRRRPAHVFVTQNGDWPARERGGEYRFSSCDGLVCTNPVFFERNRERWFSELIPNGIDPARFHPGPADRAALGLPGDRPIVVMVSALTESKRVARGPARGGGGSSGGLPRGGGRWTAARGGRPPGGGGAPRPLPARDVPTRADAGSLPLRGCLSAHRLPGVLRQRVHRGPGQRNAGRGPRRRGHAVDSRTARPPGRYHLEGGNAGGSPRREPSTAAPRARQNERPSRRRSTHGPRSRSVTPGSSRESTRRRDDPGRARRATIAPRGPHRRPARPGGWPPAGRGRRSGG